MKQYYVSELKAKTSDSSELGKRYVSVRSFGTIDDGTSLDQQQLKKLNTSRHTNLANEVCGPKFAKFHCPMNVEEFEENYVIPSEWEPINDLETFSLNISSKYVDATNNSHYFYAKHYSSDCVQRP